MDGYDQILRFAWPDDHFGHANYVTDEADFDISDHLDKTTSTITLKACKDAF